MRSLRSLRTIMGGLLALALLVSVTPAFAVDPVVDYGAFVASGKTELLTAITVALPLIFGIMATLTGVALVWRKFKGAARS
jgi:hypothetical protein